MPDREAPRSAPDRGASRLDAVERLRRQLEQIESRTRSAGSTEYGPDITGPATRRHSPEDESGSAERSAGAGRGDGRRTGEPAGGTEAQAKDVCLRLLTDRARSRAELADKLAAKGFTARIAERVLNRLTEVGLVDDAAFAEQWVHSRHTFSGKGKKVLAQELRRKGVSDVHAEPALAAITPADESARAAELVQRKLATLPADMPREKVTARLVGMLARRGYQQAMAYAVVKDELAAADREPDISDTVQNTLGQKSPRPQRSTSVESVQQEDEPSSGSAAAQMGRSRLPELDAEQAAELVRRKLRSIPPDLPTDKATARLVGLLARRGCPQSLAYAVVRAELVHRPTPDSEEAANRLETSYRSSGTAARRRRTPTVGAGVLPQERADLDHADLEPAGVASLEQRTDPDEDEQARELVRRKLRTLPRSLAQDKLINRLVGMLARRGYSSSIAYTVVNEELAAADLL